MILDQVIKRTQWVNFLQKSIPHNTISTGKNIAKYSRGNIYKTEIQSEIVQNYQEVKLLNQNYKQKYCNILKMWNL